MRLLGLGRLPPMVLFDDVPLIETPVLVLPKSSVPVTSVPMKFPRTMLFAVLFIAIPWLLKRLMTRPFTREPVPFCSILRPDPDEVVAPLSSMIGLPTKPGWDGPSVITGSRVGG